MKCPIQKQGIIYQDNWFVQENQQEQITCPRYIKIKNKEKSI